MKVLNYGSLNIDYVYSVPHFVFGGETLSSSGMVRNAGGKGANQSAALAKSGLEVYHAGKIGKDGEFILNLLGSYGVDTRFVTVTDSASGHAIIQIDSSKQNAILLYPGGNHCIAEAEIEEVFRSFGSGDWLVLQNEINNLDLIMEKAIDTGMDICFNAAPFDASVNDLPLDKVRLIVVNEIEGAGLAGCSSDDKDHLIEELGSKYPSNDILLTLGREGACYISRGRVWHQDIIDYPVLDTTAAGDTFIGYFLASRIDGYDIQKALFFASRASGIAVSRKGAMESIPVREEVFF